MDLLCTNSDTCPSSCQKFSVHMRHADNSGVSVPACKPYSNRHCSCYIAQQKELHIWTLKQSNRKSGVFAHLTRAACEVQKANPDLLKKDVFLPHPGHSGLLRYGGNPSSPALPQSQPRVLESRWSCSKAAGSAKPNADWSDYISNWKQ